MNWKTDALCRIAAVLAVLMVGGLVALACAEGDWSVWKAGWQAARWERSFVTAMEVLAAMVMAFGLATMIRPLFRGPTYLLGFWLGKAIAFFPITCLAWAFLGWWIGQRGYPIWTLMPAADAAESMTPARWLWTWVPAVALLVVPLTAQCLSLSLEKSPRARDLGFSMFGLLALMLVIPVEDILGIEGAGSSLARVLRQPENALTDASAVWMLTGTVMFLAVCLHLPLHPWPKPSSGSRKWVRFILSACLKLSAWLCLARFVLRGPSGEYRDTVGSSEFFAAFAQPSASLSYATTPLLCALSLWALGHIIRPRPKTFSYPSTHG